MIIGPISGVNGATFDFTSVQSDIFSIFSIKDGVFETLLLLDRSSLSELYKALCRKDSLFFVDGYYPLQIIYLLDSIRLVFKDNTVAEFLTNELKAVLAFIIHVPYAP